MFKIIREFLLKFYYLIYKPIGSPAIEKQPTSVNPESSSTPAVDKLKEQAPTKSSEKPEEQNSQDLDKLKNHINNTLLPQALDSSSKNSYKAAKELLNIPNIRNHLTLIEITDIIYNNRKQFNPKKIKTFLEKHDLNMFKLAQHNADSAIKILGSRLFNSLTSIEAATSCYEHRKDKEFFNFMSTRNILIQICQKAVIDPDKSVAPEVIKIFKESTTILSILYKHYQQNPSFSLQKDNPFKILGIDEKLADTQMINKAYRQKALIAHPDKGGNEEDMKRLNKAKDKAIEAKDARNKAKARHQQNNNRQR